MHKLTNYFYFLQKFQTKNSSFDLSLTEINLLHSIAYRHYNGETIQVNDLLALREIASRATLQVSIVKLVEKRILVTKTGINDRRVKHVELTKLGHKYFSDLSDSLVMAVKR